MGLRQWTLGFICGVALIGCAAASFPYKYYSLKADRYDGALLGPTASDDLPLSVCEPDASASTKCLVMKTADFLRLKAEYKNIQNQLIECQQGQ